MKTVVFDFDGVIHGYQSGGQGDPAIISDPVVPGIREVIEELRASGYKVVVTSTRCASNLAIHYYLLENNIFVDDIRTDKPPAVCYIDDRAICFDGHPENLVEKIKAFKP